MAQRVAFATEEVGRIFLVCKKCFKVKPHYDTHSSMGNTAYFGCRKCGWREFVPHRLPEWKAAIWVLVVGWLWRKTILKKTYWDPRAPHRAG